MNNDEVMRLILDMGPSAANVKAVETEADKLNAKLEDLADSADKAGGKTANMGQSMLQTGRIVQDFAQGGIGGVLNNIEGLIGALGGGAGLAGALTVAGVAFALLAPKVKAFGQALIDGSNEIPKATDHLKRMDDELRTANKTLDELREKQSLTNTELRTFNDLTARAAALQRELTEAKRREAEFERLRQSRSDEERQTGSDVAEYVGKDIDALRREAQGEVTRRGAESGGLKDLSERARVLSRAAQTNGAYAGAARRAQQAVDAERQRLKDEADKQVDRALSGQEGGLETLLDWLPKGSRFRKGLSELTPEARRRQDAEVAAAEEEGRRAHEAGVRRRGKVAKNREVAALERDYALGNAGIDQADRTAREKQIQRDLQLGRRVGQEAQRDDAGRHKAEAAKVPAGHLPLLPMNAGAAQLDHAMLANQEQMTANMAALQAMQRRAEAVNQANRQIARQRRQPAMNGGW